MPTAGEPAGRVLLSGIRNKISSSLFTHHKSSSFIGLFCLHPIFYFSIFEVMKSPIKISISFFFALCSLFSSSFSQTNLVPNPSFEQYDTCPQAPSKINFAKYWFNASTGTTDYYNACFDTLQPWASLMDVPSNFIGYEYAKTGNAYAGLFASYGWLDYREYAETKLVSQLQIGTKYYVLFYVSLPDSANYATDDIGILFASDSTYLNAFYNISATPQISNTQGLFLTNKIGWTRIEGSFVADSAYKYLIIGNF